MDRIRLVKTNRNRRNNLSDERSTPEVSLVGALIQSRIIKLFLEVDLPYY